ncbi:MAG: hypothetical protein C5B59_11845 [Bacteroidetes bacterium]|nr:MAG: hypothetical protein C5B59_11845 [Bacteroidota bacterium]
MDKKKTKKKKDEKELPGDPAYPAKDDIYNHEKEEEYVEDDEAVKDLDIPGSELDDPDEAIGEEDEENNYYSLGGEDHEDLEEDKS